MHRYELFLIQKTRMRKFREKKKTVNTLSCAQFDTASSITFLFKDHVVPKSVQASPILTKPVCICVYSQMYSNPDRNTVQKRS